LIPGSVNYFHLYFLDLAKKQKDTEAWNDEQDLLYDKFEEKFGNSHQFFEVEMWLLVFNRLDTIPKLTENSNDEDVDENIDLIEYLYEQYVDVKKSEIRKPSFLTENIYDSNSQSESEDILGNQA